MNQKLEFTKTSLVLCHQEAKHPLGQPHVDALVTGCQVTGVEEVTAEVFDVIGSDGVGEDRSQVVSASWRDFPLLLVEERPMHASRSDDAPAIPELAGSDAVDGEAAAG